MVSGHVLKVNTKWKTKQNIAGTPSPKKTKKTKQNKTKQKQQQQKKKQNKGKKIKKQKGTTIKNNCCYLWG